LIFPGLEITDFETPVSATHESKVSVFADAAHYNDNLRQRAIISAERRAPELARQRLSVGDAAEQHGCGLDHNGRRQHEVQ
jgi:hypothetical protein